MNALLNVYICALKKKSAPLLPEETVKCTLMTHSKFTDTTPTKINKYRAVAKVKLGYYKTFKDI